jgi:hypothetical protein
LDELSPRERKVLSLRSGLDVSSRRPLSLLEVSREFGVTVDTIRTIEQRALRKLKPPVKAAVSELIQRGDTRANCVATRSTDLPLCARRRRADHHTDLSPNTMRIPTMDTHARTVFTTELDHAEAVGAIILLEHAIQHLRDHWKQDLDEVTAAP